MLAAMAVAFPVAAGPGTPFPDAQVRRAGGPQLGDNIYNEDGTGQTVGGHAARRYHVGDVRWFYVYAYNDGSSGDTFKLGATEPVAVRPTGAPAAQPFLVQYLLPTGEDVTASVDHGAFVTPLLNPGERYAIRVKVTVTDEAEHGSELFRLILVWPSSNSSLKDAVGIRMIKK